MNGKRSRRFLSLLTAAVAIALAGCAATPGPSATTKAESLAELAEEQLESLAGVETVQASQTENMGNTGADRWNADLWSISIAVTMLVTATPDETAAAAEATRDFSVEHSGAGRWSAQILAGGRDDLSLEDSTAPSAVQFDVFPTVWRSPTEAAQAALEARAVAGVGSVALVGDWPSFHAADAVTLGTAHEQVRHLELFAAGGSYGTLDGRLRFVDLPHRVSAGTLAVIIGVATAYPQADIALEAPLVGQQWPQLYLNHLTADEATAITATLTARALAAERVEGYAIPFFMRVSGPDGSTDVSDLIGGN